MAIPLLVGVGVGAAVTGLQYNGIANQAAEVAAFVVHIAQKFQFEGRSVEDQLLLSEAFVLLWHQDDTKDLGLPRQETRAVTLLGAVILDLIALKRIRIDSFEKKKHVSHRLVVADAAPIGNYLDRLFLKLVKQSKPKSVKKWLTMEQLSVSVTNSADAFKYGEEILEDFASRNVMEKHGTKKMKVFNQNYYTLTAVDLRENLKIRLKRVVLDSQPAYGHTMAILGLLLASDQYNSSLLHKVFAEHEIVLARHNMASLIGAPPKRSDSAPQTPTSSRGSPRTPKEKRS